MKNDDKYIHQLIVIDQ